AVTDGGDRAQAVEVEATDEHRRAVAAALVVPDDDAVALALGDELGAADVNDVVHARRHDHVAARIDRHAGDGVVGAAAERLRPAPRAVTIELGDERVAVRRLFVVGGELDARELGARGERAGDRDALVGSVARGDALHAVGAGTADAD